MKKVLIRIPNKEEGVLLAFPLMYALNELYKDVQINVIADSDTKNFCLFLPFNVKFFIFPHIKDSILGIHHYAYNLLDVFNIDLYFDLQNSFKSAFMGFAFRAHNRIGVKKKYNSIFLNHEVENIIDEKFDSYPLHYLESFAKNKFKDFKINKKIEAAEKLEQILIFISNPELKFGDNLFWPEFFNCFLPSKFIIYTQGNYDWIDFIKKLNPTHQYMHIIEEDFIKLEVLFKSVIGIISDQFQWNILASFYDMDSFALNVNNTPSLIHYTKRPKLVFLNDNNSVKIVDDNGLKKVKSILEFVDQLHLVWKI